MSTVPHISAMAAAQSVEREWQIVPTPAAFLCTLLLELLWQELHSS